MRPFLIAAVALIFLLLVSCHRTEDSATQAERYSTREGQNVVLHPSGVAFHLPSQWLEWHERFHSNLHLTRAQLEKVRNGGGEWDTEYGKVVNAALPFADCAAHVGGEGWGLEGASFGDVQLRAYVSKLSRRKILAEIHGPALDMARVVARQAPTPFPELAPDTKVVDADEGRWRQSIIQYPLWYGHYGGLARMRFYVTEIKDYTVVLVFMGGEDEEVQAILKSVSMQPGN